ncbi:purine-cytosine permease family protein [Longivirga aurantiaca]|uniref:Purine-cytosine permease family protein n=1 Tax=Longivirga aurantiaca TaxID=1837743 RepID=A0ABW1SYA6_9ACTN
MDQATVESTTAEHHAVEQHGVDTIPDVERTSRPRDVVGILWGGNLALSVAVFGWLVVLYGLGWWASVSAILVGTLVGSLAVAPLSLLGFRSGTNNSVTSGAYFGVRGRLIASVIGLLLCLGYVALTVWTGGEAVVVGLDRARGTEGTDGELAIGYVVIAALVAAVGIYGYRWLVRVNKLIVPLVGGAMLLTVIGLWGSFDASYAGTPDEYILGGFWPTWLLAALTAGVAGPVSYVTQTGDWTRYISPRRHDPRRLVGAAFVGLFVGLIVPTLFGAFVSVVAFDPDSFVAGLVNGVPSWLLLPVIAAAVVGSLGQGGMNLYSMGLDLDAILPRLTRTQATVTVAVVSTALVFLGRFVWSAETAVTTFVVVLTSLATPWAVITMIAFTRTRGRFDEPSLQVFNRRETGGAYWYTAGWNGAAVVAWLAGSVVGVLSNSTDVYAGPIADALGGVDASFLTSAVVAGLVYLALVAARPAALAAVGSSEGKAS